jgi:Amino acid permease
MGEHCGGHLHGSGTAEQEAEHVVSVARAVRTDDRHCIAECNNVGVQISARVLLALTALGVSALVIFDVAILWQDDADGLAWTSFAPWNSDVGFGGFALGVGIAMTGFSGFETAVFLAEEARLPRGHVPRAVIGAGLLAVVFFVLTTFAIVIGYGADAAAKNWPVDSAGAAVGLSDRYLSLGFSKFLLLLLAISSLASALGTVNLTSRVMFSWGRDGYLPSFFGRTHLKFLTPHTARSHCRDDRRHLPGRAGVAGRLVRIVVRNGTRLPPDSAQGRVFTAFGYSDAKMPTRERAEILRSRLVMKSAVVVGIRSIATPPFQERELVATIALVGTSPSMPANVESPLARTLVATAEVVSAELGVLRGERPA